MSRRPTPLSTPAVGLVPGARTQRERELELENLRLRRRVDEEVALRDELLAGVSHDLRTPLQVLSLHLDTLARSQAARSDDAGLRARVEKMQAQIAHAVGLVEKILDAASLDGGGQATGAEKVDLAALAATLRDQFADQLERAACALTVDAPSPVWVRGDSRRLRQVFANLVGNAIKFGPAAPIEIRVREDDVRGRAVASVRDHGVGIAAAEHQRVFEKYGRAGRRDRPGVGLGLWIARRVIEAHGGLLLLDSDLGLGATFTFELPLARLASVPPS